jgi:raffinose/stachyose/melibiose transport system substrate-binding protein
MSKRLSVLVAALVVSGLLLSACAAPAPAPTPAAQAEPAKAEPTKAPEPTKVPAASKLTVWASSTIQPSEKQLLKDFEAATGIPVELEIFPDPFEENVFTRWATGERPDILFFHLMGNWLVQLRPHETLIEQSDRPWVKNMLEGLSPFVFDGKIYGAMINYPFVDGVYYSKDLFTELGLPFPKTYNDLFALCKTIKEKKPGVTPLYTAGGTQWPVQVPVFIQWADAFADGKLWDELNTNKARWTDPRLVKAIENFKKLQDAGCLNENVLTATFEEEQKVLVEGKAAMVSQGTWMVGPMLEQFGKETLDKKVGFFTLAENSNRAVWQSGSSGIYAPKTGKADREATALRFVDWATGEGYGKFLADSKQFPVFKGHAAPTDAPQIYVEATKAMEAGAVPVFSMPLKAAYGAFQVFLAEMLAGDKTPLQVAEALDEEFQRSAQQIGLPEFKK